MQTLNLPTYSFKIKLQEDHRLIFDTFRKKYIVLTPEEWVRQNFARFLVEERNVPPGRLVLEKSLVFNQMKRRCDILIYGDSEPLMMVECKAPEIKIKESVFDQIAVYNLEFRVKYLIVSNGMEHYCCEVDFQRRKISFLDNIPDYSDLKP